MDQPQFESIDDFIKAIGGEEAALRFISKLPDPLLVSERQRWVREAKKNIFYWWRPFGQ